MGTSIPVRPVAERGNTGGERRTTNSDGPAERNVYAVVRYRASERTVHGVAELGGSRSTRVVFLDGSRVRSEQVDADSAKKFVTDITDPKRGVAPSARALLRVGKLYGITKKSKELLKYALTYKKGPKQDV